MIKTKTEMREVIVTEDVICNRCGKSCMDSIGMNYEYAYLKANWGYYSGKDMEIDEAHICSKCFNELVNDWKIDPCIN